ncbi:MAG: hypothetical protein NTZ09_12625 [Candidatus Hydrogenedentes bacterium]|nr:hypothetical protein [Candidatus Hydrogenedentota bacterium]
MLATLLTVFTAIAAVFVMVLVWVGIDRLAHNTLGERNRCSHSFDPDAARAQTGGCCGQHASCPLNEEQSGRPTYTIRQ